MAALGSRIAPRYLRAYVIAAIRSTTGDARQVRRRLRTDARRLLRPLGEGLAAHRVTYQLTAAGLRRIARYWRK